MSILFRQLFDSKSSTYTYLLADEGSREAVIIDPVYEQSLRDAALVNELGLSLTAILETHVHADHVTGAALLKEMLGGVIALSHRSGAEGADSLLLEGDVILFGRHQLSVLETPGHTDGCLSFVLDGGAIVFTGDALLIRGAGRTDFQQGDAGALYDSVREKIFTLPDACLVYPAHDYAGRTVSSVGEERHFNPRLGAQRSKTDFVGYMTNLGLPHPKQIDAAVPANLRCGRPQEGEVRLGAPSWGDLRYTFAGVWEVEPMWLAENLAKVTLLDVREADELVGPLGRIEGAVHIPLGELAGRVSELPPGRPIVTVCRSGGRSAQATVILNRANRTQVANLAGGMLLWREQGFPAR